MTDLLRDADGDLVVRDGDLALASPLEADTRQVQYLVKTTQGDDLTDPRLGAVKTNTAGHPLTRTTLDQAQDDVRRALMHKAAFTANELKILSAAFNLEEYGVFIQLNRTYNEEVSSPWLAAFLYDVKRGVETQLDGTQTDDL